MDELRKCIGSARFGIDAHEAPIDEFPVQPSQKDGLGRLCKPHWNQYTTALRKAAAAANAEAALAEEVVELAPMDVKPSRNRKTSEPVVEEAEAASP